MKRSLFYLAAAILIPTAAMSQSLPIEQVQDVLFTAFQLTGSTAPPPNSMVLQFESEINAYDYNESIGGGRARCRSLPAAARPCGGSECR